VLVRLWSRAELFAFVSVPWRAWKSETRSTKQPR